MPKSDGNLSHKVLFKPQTNPTELGRGGGFSGRGFDPCILSSTTPGFWDRAMLLAKGRKIVAEEGQTHKEGVSMPQSRAGGCPNACGADLGS